MDRSGAQEVREILASSPLNDPCWQKADNRNSPKQIEKRTLWSQRAKSGISFRLEDESGHKALLEALKKLHDEFPNEEDIYVNWALATATFVFNYKIKDTVDCLSRQADIEALYREHPDVPYLRAVVHGIRKELDFRSFEEKWAAEKPEQDTKHLRYELSFAKRLIDASYAKICNDSELYKSTIGNFYSEEEAKKRFFEIDPTNLIPLAFTRLSDIIGYLKSIGAQSEELEKIEEGSLSRHTYNTPLSVEIQTLIKRHGYAAVSLEVAAHAGQQVATSESSLVQAEAIFKNSKLGKLLQRYKDILESIELPSNGFKTLEQARAAARLSSTYDSLTEEQVKLGYEPTLKDDRVTEARRLRADFYRKQQKALRPTPIRAGRPKKVSVPK